MEEEWASINTFSPRIGTLISLSDSWGVESSSQGQQEHWWGVSVAEEGISSRPPVATPAGVSEPGATSLGTAASQNAQQLFEGGGGV